MSCENQFLREARIILRKLARQGAVAHRHRGQWTIGRRGTAPRAASSGVDGATMERLIGDGMLMAEPGGTWRLSAAGETWLMSASRQPAGEDNDRFRRQHQVHAHTGRGRGKTLPCGPGLNETETPLGWLRSRKGRDGAAMLSAEQFEAGERLRRDFEFAGQSPRVTQSWDPTQSAGRGRKGGGRSPAPDPTDSQLAARQRYFAAIETMGPELSSIVVDICCLGSGLEAAERRLDWPKRSGKLVLQIGLQTLARHYGLLDEETRRPAARSGLGHWGRDGYRPTSNRGQGQ